MVHGASRAFNPTLPQSIVDDALKRDPAAARAEWLGEWRDDIAAFSRGNWSRLRSTKPSSFARLSLALRMTPSSILLVGWATASRAAIAHKDDERRVRSRRLA